MTKDNNHIDNQTLIERYMWGETSAEESAAVKNLIAINPDLQKYFIEIQNLYINSKPSNESLTINTSKAKEQFFEKIDTKNKKNPKLIPLYAKIISGIAAAILLFFAIQILYPSSETKQVIIASETKATDTLPDGSILDLNVASSISFYNNSPRSVEMTKGEVFFNIKKDTNHPFTIKTPQHKITVLGTSFNVKISNNLELSVYTGTVKLESSSDSLKQIILHAGDQITTNKEWDKISKTEFDKNITFWQSGILDFNNVEFKKAIDKISEVYNTAIEIQDSSLNNGMLTATFNNKNLNSVLEIIKYTFEVDIIKEENKYIIRKNKPTSNL